MTLSYEEGVATLRSVFPSWDVEVLAQLLEANEGHLENTIDMALSMEPPTSTTAQMTATPVHTPPPAPVYATQTQAARRSPRASPRGQPTRRSRVTLPDDFLRLPSDDGVVYGARPMTEQERQDALLAQMMQDEIFREQLFADEEFSAHFRDSRAHERRSSASAPREKSATEIANETFNAMSAKWSVMSEAMKRKAHEMYLKFQTRDDAPGKRDPYSHRPLMADDSSDDEDGTDCRGSTADIRKRNGQDAGDGSAFSPHASNAGMARRSRASTNKKDD